MTKKEQFTKEEHKRAKHEAQKLVSIKKDGEKLIRIIKAMNSPSELRYYRLLSQYIKDDNDTLLNDKKEIKEFFIESQKENSEGGKFNSVKINIVKHHKRTLKRNEEVRLKYQKIIKDNQIYTHHE